MIFQALLVSFCAGAFAANDGYTSGKDYYYSYEAQALAGVAGASTTFTGVQMYATVQLQVRDDNVVNMKYHNLTAYTGFTKVEVSPPLQFVRKTGFKLIPVDSSIAEATSKFSYKAGEISGLETAKNENVFVVNSRKGFLNVLQLGLNKTRLNADSSESFFSVMEEGPSGVCPSWYTVHPADPSTKLWKLEKQKDLGSCERYNTFADLELNGAPCAPAKAKHEIISNKEHAHYEMKGTLNDFLIKNGHLHHIAEHGDFFDDKMTMPTVYIIQQLKLIKQEDTQDTLEMPSDTVKHSSAIEVDIVASLKGLEGEEKVKDEIKKRLSDIVSLSEDEVDKQAGIKATEVVNLLKRLTLSELDELFSEVTDKDTRGVLTQLLTGVTSESSTQTALFLLKLVRNGEVSGEVVDQYIAEMSLFARPHSDIVNHLLDLTVKESDDLVLRKAACLAAGTMTNRLLSLHRRNGMSEDMCKTHMQPIVTRFRDMLNAGIKEADAGKYTFELYVPHLLVSIGNAGLKEFVSDLRALLKKEFVAGGRMLKHTVIHAFHKIAEADPAATRSTLLPIFFDEQQSEMMRISVFDKIMATKPSFTTLKAMARVMRQDGLPQLKGYIYTTWRSLTYAKLTRGNFACIKKMTSRVRRIIVFLKRLPSLSEGRSYQAYMSHYFLRNLGGGFQVILHQVFKNDQDLLPKSAGFEWKMLGLGHLLDVYGVDVIMLDMEGVFFNTSGAPMTQKNFDDGIVTAKNPLDIAASLVKEICQPQDHTKKRNLMLAFKIHGFMVRIVDFAYMNQICKKVQKKISVEDGQMQMKLPINTRSTRSINANVHSVATSLGVVVSLKITNALVNRAKGSFNSTLSATFQDILNTGVHPWTSKADLALHDSLYHYVSVDLEFPTPLGTFGFRKLQEVWFTAPIHASLEIKHKEPVVAVFRATKSDDFMKNHQVLRMSDTVYLFNGNELFELDDHEIYEPKEKSVAIPTPAADSMEINTRWCEPKSPLAANPVLGCRRELEVRHVGQDMFDQLEIKTHRTIEYIGNDIVPYLDGSSDIVDELKSGFKDVNVCCGIKRGRKLTFYAQLKMSSSKHDKNLRTKGKLTFMFSKCHNHRRINLQVLTNAPIPNMQMPPGMDAAVTLDHHVSKPHACALHNACPNGVFLYGKLAAGLAGAGPGMEICSWQGSFDKTKEIDQAMHLGNQSCCIGKLAKICNKYQRTTFSFTHRGAGQKSNEIDTKMYELNPEVLFRLFKRLSERNVRIKLQDAKNSENTMEVKLKACPGLSKVDAWMKFPDTNVYVYNGPLPRVLGGAHLPLTMRSTADVNNPAMKHIKDREHCSLTNGHPKFEKKINQATYSCYAKDSHPVCEEGCSSKGAGKAKTIKLYCAPEGSALERELLFRLSLGTAEEIKDNVIKQDGEYKVPKGCKEGKDDDSSSASDERV